jgi:hypothetical protein
MVSTCKLRDVYLQSEGTAAQKRSYTDMLLFWLEVFYQTHMSQEHGSRLSYKNYYRVTVVTNTCVKAALFEP